MKKTIHILLALCILVNLAGCEPLRKKFTRKKKEVVKMPRVHQIKEYEKKPTPELYKKHYAYWTSWQSELIRVLGQNHKKDMRCAEELIGNLRDMQNMLDKEKADELETHIEKIVKLKDVISEEDMTPVNRDYVRRALEREERAIKRDFYYDKIKGHLKESFVEEAASPQEDAGK